MAVEYDPNGTPILTNDSLISDVPPYTNEVASLLGGITSNDVDLDQIRDDIAALQANAPSFAGPYHHNFGNLAAGAGSHSLTGFVFNGKVGDVWTGSFSLGIGSLGGTGGIGNFVGRLRLVSGIQLSNGSQGGTTFDLATGKPAVGHATFSWRATQANDYLILDVVENAYGVTDTHINASAINHGNLSATTRMKRERTKDAK